MGLKVNSYCLFNGYYSGLSLLIRAHFAIFPQGWQLRIYHDSTFGDYPVMRAIDRLREANLVKTIYVNEKVIRCRSMLWRMIPIWDPEVDYVFCKDADSVPTLRERKIMEDFINGGYPAMGINDNPAHSIPMMGGMIGFKTKKFIEKSGIKTFGDFMLLNKMSEEFWANHGSDQVYINSYVYPRIQKDMILYRPFPGAQKISPRCEISVPNINIQDVHENIQTFSDKVAGYIGACGVVGPLATDLYNDLAKINCKTVLDLYDLYGNSFVNSIIREEEAKLWAK